MSGIRDGREPTSFVGRAGDLARLAEILRAAPLCTVVGPGGVGKTRLARRFAAAREGAYWFCDLSEARDAGGVCQAVAAALELPASAGGSAAALGRALAALGPALIVLDNFEQVAEAAPETVGEWIARAPAARFLATSREPLRIDGEQVHELGPLKLDSEAVQLFLDRARAARPDYTPGDAEQEVVAELVARLDGLPLAIELCAARVRVLTARQILERLPRRFELLADGGPGSPARHATLRAAIDWSWNLLSPAEQEALAQCAVFRGGFTLEAAEAVLDLSAHPGAPWVVDLLQSLRDQSLLAAQEPPGLPGELRFALTESVHAFAEEKLSERGARAAEARHAAYYLRWAAARAGFAAPGQHGYRRLVLERHNLMTIFRRAALDPDGARQAVEAFLAFQPVRITTGFFDLADVDRAVELASRPSVTPAERADVIAARGNHRSLRGRPAEALEDFRAALTLAEQLRDPLREARILRSMAALLRNLGPRAEAVALFERALERARQARAEPLEAMIHTGLAVTAMDEGRFEEAERHLLPCVKLYVERGDRMGEGTARCNLAIVAFQLGRPAEARAHFERAIALHQAAGSGHAEGMARGNFALFLHDQGQLAQARAEYEASLRILRQVGDRRAEGITLGYLACLAWEEGDLHAAEEGAARAVTILRDVGDRTREALFEGYLGALLAVRGRQTEASARLARAGELARAHPGPRYLELMEALGGFVDLARARETEARGEWSPPSICAGRPRRRRSGPSGGRASRTICASWPGCCAGRWGKRSRRARRWWPTPRGAGSGCPAAGARSRSTGGGRCGAFSWRWFGAYRVAGAAALGGRDPRRRVAWRAPGGGERAEPRLRGAGHPAPARPARVSPHPRRRLPA